MPKLTLLHNPRCSKSRQALQLLKEAEKEVEVVEYLKHPLTESEIKTLASKLNVSSIIDMMRVKEPEYKEANLSKDSSEQDFIKAITKYPKLLERPVLIAGEKAVIGRPPENIQQLI